MIEQLKSELRDSGASQRVINKWCKRLDAWGAVNRYIPFNFDYPQQDFQTINYYDHDQSKYLIRIYTRRHEMYRIVYDVTEEYYQIFEWGMLGRTGVYAYRPMHENFSHTRTQAVLKFISPVADYTGDISPYLDTQSVHMSALQLVMNGNHHGLEILIKQGFKRFVELLHSEYPYLDEQAIRHIFKWNRELMRNASSNKIYWAHRIDCHSYQRGMLGISPNTLNSILPQVPWDVLQKGARKHRMSISMYANDYADYLEDLEAFGLPKQPSDLYEAKERKRRMRADFLKQKQIKETPEIIDRLERIDYPTVKYGDYILKPFNSYESMHNEGEELHHCIAQSQYLTGQAYKTKILYAIRHKQRPHEPLASLELTPKSLNIVQCRGKYNESHIKEFHKEIKAVQDALKNYFKEANNAKETLD